MTLDLNIFMQVFIGYSRIRAFANSTFRFFTGVFRFQVPIQLIRKPFQLEFVEQVRVRVNAFFWSTFIAVVEPFLRNWGMTQCMYVHTPSKEAAPRIISAAEGKSFDRVPTLTTHYRTASMTLICGRCSSLYSAIMQFNMATTSFHSEYRSFRTNVKKPYCIFVEQYQNWRLSAPHFDCTYCHYWQWKVSETVTWQSVG